MSADRPLMEHGLGQPSGWLSRAPHAPPGGVGNTPHRVRNVVTHFGGECRE